MTTDAPFFQKINGLDESRQAMAALAAAMRHRLLLYTPTLLNGLFSDDDLVISLTTQLIGARYLNARWIVPPMNHWRRQCPRLLNAHERLISKWHWRTLAANESRDRPTFNWLFCVVDQRHALVLEDPQRLIGYYALNHPEISLPLVTFFNEIWETSHADGELRRLHI